MPLANIVPVYVVFEAGVTFTLPFPDALSVITAPPGLSVTVAPGVPPATDMVAFAPLQIVVLSVIVAEGNELVTWMFVTFISGLVLDPVTL